MSTDLVDPAWRAKQGAKPVALIEPLISTIGNVRKFLIRVQKENDNEEVQ
jgi:hypothetical protein